MHQPTQPNQTTKEHQAQSVIEHLRSLRNVILSIFGTVLLGAVIVHSQLANITDFLLRPLGDKAAPLQFLSPLDPLYFMIRVDLSLGFLLALPFVIFLIWRYISPAFGLQRAYLGVLVILSSTVLSVIAAAYTYLLLVPVIINYMANLTLPGTELAFTALGYFSFIFSTTILLMLVFQIPLIIVGLSAIGLLQPQSITANRQYIYPGLFIGAALLSPTTDAISLLLIAGPALVVVELGTLVASTITRRTNWQ